MYDLEGLKVLLWGTGEVKAYNYCGVHIEVLCDERGEALSCNFLNKEAEYSNLRKVTSSIDAFYEKIKQDGWSLISTKVVKISPSDYATLNLIGKLGDGYRILLDGKQIDWSHSDQSSAQKIFEMFDENLVKTWRG